MARSNLVTFAQETGMKIHRKTMIVYGEYRGYKMVIQHLYDKRQILTTMSVNGGTPQQNEAVSQCLLSLSQSKSYIASANFSGNVISVCIKHDFKNSIENLKEVLHAVTDCCRMNSMVSCCKGCGSTENLAPFSINGEITFMCTNCFEKVRTDLSQAQQVVKKKKGNIITGIVGALLGSLIGVALWVIVYQIGYIAGVVGFVMAVCCMKGYQLFGGKLNVGGMVISVLIAVAMLFFAENVCLALEIYNTYQSDYDITFFDAFKSISEFLKEDEVFWPFVKDLVFGYIFMLAASFPTIISTYKQANLDYELTRLE